MLKPKFDSKQIRLQLQKYSENLDYAIISRLSYIGETFVTNARKKTKQQGGFGNITGNLRSSIGYVVLKDGKPVKGSDFESVNSGLKGSSSGKSFIKDVAKQYKGSAFALIVVAGMDYAAAVESRGLDVITGSSKIAEEDLKKALSKFDK